MQKIFFVSVLFLLLNSSCSHRKHWRVNNEASHPATYLKGKILNPVFHDSLVSFNLEIVNHAKYSTYHDFTALFFYFNAKGDTIGNDGYIFSPYRYGMIVLPPGRKCVIETDLYRMDSAKKLDLDFVSGMVAYADTVPKRRSVFYKKFRD